MPRASYYIPAGNPLQHDLLPKHHLDLEFPYAGGNVLESRKLRNQLLGNVLLFDVLMFTALVLAGRLAVEIVLLVVLIWAIVGLVAAAKAKELSTFFATAATGLAVLLFAMGAPKTPPVALLAIAVLLGRQAYDFGHHWCHRCTVSPLTRAEARLLRSQWTRNRLVIALVPTIAAVVAIVLARLWLFPLFLGLFSAVQIANCRNLRSAASAIKQSLTSWCAYNSDNAKSPGLFQSPAGSAFRRRFRMTGHAGLTAIVWLTISAIQAEGPSLSAFAPYDLVPGIAFVLLSALVQLPLLEEALERRRQNSQLVTWNSVTEDLRDSRNPLVRDAHFRGTLDADGSPLIVGRQADTEHIHFVGSSGSGKTSKGLNPWIERTISFGDCSLIVVDLKADTLEMLATMQMAAEDHRRRGGREMPLKVFTSQNDRPTHVYNPFLTSYWSELTLFERTDILCGAMGLTYGTDYGAGYYSAANAAVLYEAMRLFPQCRSFHELADRCRYVITHPGKTNLLPNTAKNADHLYAQLCRMGDVVQLQACPERGYSEAMLQDAIDLSSLFREPQLVYVHLSSTLAAGSAPAIGRLFAYMLLTSATQTQRDCQVYLVIDEFQRMVAGNLDYLFQLARSMNVGIVLANQCMADLKSDKKDLTPTIEANCRFRQWFDVPSKEDRDRLMSMTGETVETMNGTAVSSSTQGETVTTSTTETILPRLNINEILEASSHPDKSIIRLSRGDCYSQHAGLPIVVRSGFHISAEEYRRRKALGWPTPTPGMLVPRQFPPQLASSSKSSGPVIIVDGDQPQSTGMGDLFDDLKHKEGKKPRKRRRNSGQSNTNNRGSQ
jgi:hypothetical protein